jgi:large subunit ribosomal protein L10
MSKAVNAALIDGLTRELTGVDSCVVIGTAAMTVAEVSSLRNKLRAHQFRMRVVKNTIARRAFAQVDLNGLGDVLSGPSAVVYGGEGAIAISKLIVEEKKKAKDKLLIHGAFNEGEVMDGAGVDALSKVPGRHELLAMCMGGFFGPVSDMARNLGGLFTEMEGLIEALVKKKEEVGA